MKKYVKINEIFLSEDEHGIHGFVEFGNRIAYFDLDLDESLELITFMAKKINSLGEKYLDMFEQEKKKLEAELNENLPEQYKKQITNRINEIDKEYKKLFYALKKLEPLCESE